jgi:hypothetical protein
MWRGGGVKFLKWGVGSPLKVMVCYAEELVGFKTKHYENVARMVI